ncbi:MAG TPA: carboxy terminal-processing peptidase [Gemmataceae bacterium]|nr:carboxy terminal-processing peptidase [Gemmataceae bacterium]
MLRNQRLLQAKRSVAVLAAVVGLLLIAAPAFADPVPGKLDRLVIELVCDLLHRKHLTKPDLDEQLSKRLFHKFIKDLDPAKLYFTKEDVEELKKSETELGTMLQRNDISFAYDVYKRLVTRIEQRLKLVEELLKEPQDFTVKEYLSTDYDAIDHPKTDAEIRERWRKRIKYDLLLQRLGQKPVPDAEAKKQRLEQKPVADAEAKQKVLSRYQGLLKRWKQVDNYDLMEMYLSDLTASVDPHSSYMSPTTLADFDIAMHLHLEGIGALLHSDNGQTIVSEIIPGGAAAADHRLKVNDKIIGVAQGDGKFVDVIDWKLTEVVKIIRGPKGTKVQLKVIPADKIEPAIYAYTRQKIELKEQAARSEIMEQGKKPDGTPYKIGIIDLPSFYADSPSAKGSKEGFVSATEDVRKLLKEFESKGVDGVVLDLRRNGGGALSEALSLTGLFIDQGPVVQVKKGVNGEVEVSNDPEKGMVYAGPLIVLVSRFSASASEILAGALQDYGRSLTVGDKGTHGKGTVQAVADLGSYVRSKEPVHLGALKLTIDQFYRVNGDSTQNQGVKSDIVIPSLTEVLATGEKDLENALAFDHVNPVSHEELGMVPEQLKTALRTRSAQRVKDSADFAKLQKEIETVKDQRARKMIPLNEQELRTQFPKDKKDSKKGASQADEDLDDLLPPESTSGDGTPFKFARNFINTEVLHIMEDLLQGKKTQP